MQRIWVNLEGQIEELCVPPYAEEVMPGVTWGAPDDLFTPSFWKYQSEAQLRLHRYSQHRLGSSLLEEMAVCLLGGYGIPAEMGMIAFQRLREHRMLDGTAMELDVLELLSLPFKVGGKDRRYRFPVQKALYVSRSLNMAKDLSVDLPVRELRERLLSFPGIGPKTASWIVRNHRNSDEVAIIDVHIHRACILMNVFESDTDPTRDYFKLEDRFLAFSDAIKVRASVLDAIIWDFMRRIGPTSRSGKDLKSANQLHLAF